jgi:hypothetical protein
VLRAPGVSLVDDVLPVLLNELEALPGASVLLVEDYHLITSAEVHEAVAFLLEHAPVQLELVLSTRGEPPLPLARLRARGELLEIPVPELPFSALEAEALFNRGQMLGLDAADVSRLLERTEGWPAGSTGSERRAMSHAAPSSCTPAGPARRRTNSNAASSSLDGAAVPWKAPTHSWRWRKPGTSREIVIEREGSWPRRVGRCRHALIRAPW